MEMFPLSTQDKLSDMPESILENIFSCLPLRDVVRTSVLSTKWRNKWVSFPHLIFNDEIIPDSYDLLDHDKLVKIINHVLQVHRGPILTFEVSSVSLKTCSEIDSWILSLPLNSLTEFGLHVDGFKHYSVLPCLFYFKQLIRLTLVRCDIVLPVKFEGFSCLTSLGLFEVTLSDATLKCLVSACPQLEWLMLFDINGPIHIEISNPKLKFLCIYGNFTGICLKDLKLLVYASITMDYHPDLSRTCNFSKIFGSLCSIQELFLKGGFLQSLDVSDVERRLPFTYDHLETIFIELNVEDMKDILVVICLLNRSPNLRKLDFLLSKVRESAIVPVIDLQEAKDQLDCTFNKLQVVGISGFHGKEIELMLIEFILANSSVLETMNISHAINDTNKALTLSEELLRFKRASPQAEIVLNLDRSYPS